MDIELPRRFFREGHEPEVRTINNNCKISVLTMMANELPNEYNTVKADPLFAHIIAIHENSLRFSGKLVHSFMCRQIDTAKLREIWVVFGRRPLRFSLQEFHAVTGLKCTQDGNCNLGGWVHDKGFWSDLLRLDTNICLQDIMKKHIKNVKNWKRIDRLRLVYLCIIAGVLVAMDEKVAIPHKYICLVMDFGKLRNYPWGLESFDHLLLAIKAVRKKQTRKVSYSLDGFTYAFQLWIMEAIPDFGEILGQKHQKDTIVFPRCSNWSGNGTLSYATIRQLESSFGSKGVLHPFISSIGNNDIIQAPEFVRSGEFTDERVDYLLKLISAEKNWSDHIWLVMEPVHGSLSRHVEEDGELDNNIVDNDDELNTPRSEQSSVTCSKRGKKKFIDSGAEERKQKILCQRSAGINVDFNEDMKTFIQGLFEAGMTSIKAEFGGRFVEMQTELKILKNAVSEAILSRSNGEPSASMKPSNVTKDNRMQPQKKKADKLSIDNDLSLGSLGNLYDVGLTLTSDIGLELDTQEYLRQKLAHLSQASTVNGFNPPEQSNARASPDWLAPPSSSQPGMSESRETQKPLSMDWLRPELTDKELADFGRNFNDAPLVFYADEDWKKLEAWSMTFDSAELYVGPTCFTKEVANRIITPKEWLHTEDMDAIMYLFQKNTSLRRWKPDRVGFMTCLFGVRIIGAYKQFVANKKVFKVENVLLAYAKGELPAYGRTGKVWKLDVDRIYVPVNIGKNHWISLCISFKGRTVEVFDCSGLKKITEVEAFAALIPRLVKEIQLPRNKKHHSLSSYAVRFIPMKNGLNKNSCHCGVYAVKFIQCHTLALPFSLLDDENIKAARFNLATTLFKTANDPVLIGMRLNYIPPPTYGDSSILEIN